MTATPRRWASATGRRLGAGLLAMLIILLPQPSHWELPPLGVSRPPLQAFYQAPAGEPFVFPLPPLAHTPAGRPVDVTLEASGDAPSWLQLDRERLSIGGTAPLVAEDRTYRLMIRAHAGRGGDGRVLVWLRIIGQPDRRPVTPQRPPHQMECPRMSSTDVDDLTCKLLEQTDLRCVKCPATP